MHLCSTESIIIIISTCMFKWIPVSSVGCHHVKAHTATVSILNCGLLLWELTVLFTVLSTATTTITTNQQSESTSVIALLTFAGCCAAWSSKGATCNIKRYWRQ